MYRDFASDRGDIVLGWLTRVVVTLAVVALIAFDSIAIVTSRLGAALVAFALVTTLGATPLAAASPAQAQTPTVTLAPAAPTSPSANARERAHQLRQQLAALQQESEQTTEEYDAAQEQLGQVV